MKHDKTIKDLVTGLNILSRSILTCVANIELNIKLVSC